MDYGFPHANVMISYIGDDPPAVSVSSEYRNFLRIVSEQHPDWRFIIEGSNSYDPITVVKIGDEKLGTFTYEDGKYVFTSGRMLISKRKAYKSTKHLYKAMRLFNTYFKPKSTDELMTDAVGKVGKNLVTVVSQKQTQLREEYRKACQYAFPVLATTLDNISKFVDFARAVKVDEKVLDKLEIAFAENTIVGESHQCFYKGRGVVVLIRGSEYIVQELRKDSDHPQRTVHTTDTLPTHIKGKLGLLKLLPESGQFLKDVGYKLDEVTFLINESSQ